MLHKIPDNADAPLNIKRKISSGVFSKASDNYKTVLIKEHEILISLKTTFRKTNILKESGMK